MRTLARDGTEPQPHAIAAHDGARELRHIVCRNGWHQIEPGLVGEEIAWVAADGA